MKKAYIKPEVQVKTIEVCNMIASSITGISGADGLGKGGDTSDAGIESGNAKGRGGSDNWSDGLW